MKVRRGWVSGIGLVGREVLVIGLFDSAREREEGKAAGGAMHCGRGNRTS
jgi:hypothetical protein